MADLPQQLIDKLEQLVEEKFDELIKAHKINSTEIDEDVVTWENEQMVAFDGEEPIPHWFFRKFLAWLKVKIATVIVQVTEVTGITFDAIRYITPVDYDPAPDCGKIIAPFANLVIEGEDVEPTIPDPSNTTPDLAGFNQASDLMLGGLSYNKTDNKWYFRGKETAIGIPIYGLMYTWFVASDARIAPEGTHVPSNDELHEMILFLDSDASSGVNDVAGQLKEIGDEHWAPENVTVGDNAFGFSMLGGGVRNYAFLQEDQNGSFSFGDAETLKQTTGFWTKTQGFTSSLGSCALFGLGSAIIYYHPSQGGNCAWKTIGLYIRVLLDNPESWHEGDTFTDIDGNIYGTTKIGNQVWSTSNLKVTRLNDGTPINQVTLDASWTAFTNELAYCIINNGVELDVVSYTAIDKIMDLKEALHLGIVDISDLQTALDALVPKETGKGLSANDLTDELVTAIGDMTAHINIENIHLPPDGTTIIQDVDKLSVLAEGIHDMFSADAPLAIDSDGKITLVIDEATLAIVDGKLTVIGGGGEGGGKLAFDAGTGILSVDPGGETSVDLSSLAAGEGVDLTDYVKKSGEADQTIEGNIHVTGEVEPWA